MIAEEADASVIPIATVRIPVQNRFTCGSIMVNGSTPTIEIQITALRPIRSPTGPPINVPTATDARNANR